MGQAEVLALAFLIGGIAGLRSLTAPAAVANVRVPIAGLEEKSAGSRVGRVGGALCAFHEAGVADAGAVFQGEIDAAGRVDIGATFPAAVFVLGFARSWHWFLEISCLLFKHSFGCCGLAKLGLVGGLRL
jgi:hypothetical protein